MISHHSGYGIANPMRFGGGDPVEVVEFIDENIYSLACT